MLQPNPLRFVSHSPPPLMLPPVSAPWAAPSAPVLEPTAENVTGQSSSTNPVDGMLVESSPTRCNSASPSSRTSGDPDSYHCRCAEAAAGAAKATSAASALIIIIFLSMFTSFDTPLPGFVSTDEPVGLVSRAPALPLGATLGGHQYPEWDHAVKKFGDSRAFAESRV